MAGVSPSVRRQRMASLTLGYNLGDGLFLLGGEIAEHIGDNIIVAELQPYLVVQCLPEYE